MEVSRDNVRVERLGYTRLYATVTGALLVLIGLFGFLVNSEFKTPQLTDELLGVMAVNGWSNTFRVALGLLGLLMATRFSKLYAALAGLLLLALGLWGALAPNGQLLLDKLPAGRAANLLNLALGALGLITLVAVNSDGITRRLRQRMERRKRHRIARRRRRRMRRTGPRKPGTASATTTADSPSATARTGARTQRPERERSPSESERKRDEG